MVELALLSTQTGLDIPEALSIGQLSKGHHQKLIEAAELPYSLFALIFLNTAAKGVHGQVRDHLSEYKMAYIHDLTLK